MKEKRNLSGIYFRYFDPEQDKWDNRVFEDLSEDEQNKYLDDRGIEWIKSLAKKLADTINKLGDQFDLMVD